MSSKKRIIYLLDEHEDNGDTAAHCLRVLNQLRHILSLKAYQHSESALILHTKSLFSQFKSLTVLPSSVIIGLWSGIQRRAQQRCNFFIFHSIFADEREANDWEKQLYLALGACSPEDAWLALERIRCKAEAKSTPWFWIKKVQNRLYTKVKRMHKIRCDYIAE